MSDISQQNKNTAERSSTANFTIGLVNGILLSIPLWTLIVWFVSTLFK